jgi:hypothetical protein
MLRALVICPNEKTVDVGSLLAVARSEACRREHVDVNPTVRALVFVPELGVYVAVYEAPEKIESGKTRAHVLQSVVRKIGSGEAGNGLG